MAMTRRAMCAWPNLGDGHGGVRPTHRRVLSLSVRPGDADPPHHRARARRRRGGGVGVRRDQVLPGHRARRNMDLFAQIPYA